MILIIVSFLSGILSVLAPCVLPVLPVIFSGSLSGEHGSKTWRIIVAMVFSIVIFTVLLKVSTLFISIDPSFWIHVSSVIIIAYGIVLLFPELRDRFALRLRLDRVNTLTNKAHEAGGWWGDVLLGMSLGPLFSTCSPTYALLFSAVLPVNLALGIVCIVAYAGGFGGFLRILVKGGRSLIKRMYRVSDSHGVFKRVLGLILVVTGILIATGDIKQLENRFLDYMPDVSKIEQYLIKKTDIVDSIREQWPVVSPISGNYAPMAEDLDVLLEEMDVVCKEQE